MKRRPHGTGGAPGASRTVGGTRRAPHPRPDVTADVDRYDEAIHAFHKRLPLTRDAWDDLVEDEKAFAWTVSNVTQADVVVTAWEAIDRALRDGTDFAQFKADAGEKIEASWGGEDSPKLDTVFRTTMMSAYAGGREAVFSAPAVKAERPYSRFDAIDDERTCPECEALNGITLPEDDPFWDSNSPPIHFCDRCTKTGLSQRDVDDAGGPDERPEGDYADDGFGKRQNTPGADWAPDLSKYPDDLADALRVKLGA